MENAFTLPCLIRKTQPAVCALAYKKKLLKKKKCDSYMKFKMKEKEAWSKAPVRRGCENLTCGNSNSQTQEKRRVCVCGCVREWVCEREIEDKSLCGRYSKSAWNMRLTWASCQKNTDTLDVQDFYNLVKTHTNIGILWPYKHYQYHIKAHVYIVGQIRFNSSYPLDKNYAKALRQHAHVWRC